MIEMFRDRSNQSAPQRVGRPSLRTSYRYGLIAGLLLMTLAINAIIAYVNIGRLVANEEQMSRSFDLVARVQELAGLAREAETTSRAFILTGNEAQLDALRRVQESLVPALDAVRVHALDDEQKQLSLELGEAVAERLEIAQHGVELRRLAGFVAARAFIETGSGQAQTARVRLLADRMIAREQELLGLRLQQSRESADDATRTFWIATTLNVVLLGLISRLLWSAARERRRLDSAYAALRESEELRDGLTTMLVHDLRTPLTSLLGPLQMLRAESLGPLDELQREVVTIGEQSGHRLLRLINELLDIAKIEAGEMRVEREWHRVGELFNDAQHAVDGLGLGQGEGASLALDPGAETVALCGDRDLLVRVLINLVGNALRWTPRDGHIRIHAASLPDGGARVEVRDNGAGIAPEHLERIFDKFGQVSARRKGARLSTGLGLTFCRLAIEAHGGTVDVWSQPGQGSIFGFTLPAPASQNSNESG